MDVTGIQHLINQNKTKKIELPVTNLNPLRHRINL